jgi:glycosyltransferase involved in cell wall biosynthesis
MTPKMIHEKTIICFASNYNAPPTSKHHVMQMLAKDNIILWVNYHASRTPTASSSDLRYIVDKLKQVASGLKNPLKNLYVLTPLVIPLPGSRLARLLNRLLLISQVRLALKKIRKGSVQLWSFTPDISYVLGRFGEEKVVYYCVDDHASFSGYDKEQVLQDEEELCRKSDLVITTAMVLQESKKSWNSNTILVPHGVDFDHFNQAVREELPCPPELQNIPHPRLGFFGLIRDWVDVDLLAEIARKQTKWQFVLIGDADSSVNLKKYDTIQNMHFLGRKTYSELPAFCQHFDVGLIPFKVNDLTYAVNPIKLREYLSAGLPVVSTPMPEVKLYDHLVEIASTIDEFEKSIKTCLEDTEGNRAERVAAMAKETWSVKLQKISDGL